jgi:hypothetical protein
MEANLVCFEKFTFIVIHYCLSELIDVQWCHCVTCNEYLHFLDISIALCVVINCELTFSGNVSNIKANFKHTFSSSSIIMLCMMTYAYKMSKNHILIALSRWVWNNFKPILYHCEAPLYIFCNTSYCWTIFFFSLPCNVCIVCTKVDDWK